MRTVRFVQRFLVVYASSDADCLTNGPTNGRNPPIEIASDTYFEDTKHCQIHLFKKYKDIVVVIYQSTSAKKSLTGYANPRKISKNN